MKRILLSSAGILLLSALAAGWGWMRYGDLVKTPAKRLALDQFYPQMPPDDHHRYLELPISHRDPSLGKFKGFYILSPGFKAGDPVVFFLNDGQQPGVKPWTDSQDFKEDFDPFVGGLSYIVIGGRGTDPTLFPEVYDASGRLDLRKTLDLYGSNQSVEDIELVRRDMARQGLLPKSGKIMLFGLSGAGVLAQQYLAHHGRHVTRAMFASTSAPDLAARKQTTFYRGFSDFNPEAAKLWDTAARRGDFNRRTTAWMLFKLGYRSPDARRLQIELLQQLAAGDRATYRKYWITPELNVSVMAAALRWMPETDAAKVRMFELMGRDLLGYHPNGGRQVNLAYEAFGEPLKDWLAAAKTGKIAAPLMTIDRSQYQGEVLVLSGSQDNTATLDIMRGIARSYRRGRQAIVDDGHRLTADRELYHRIAASFFREGLSSPTLRSLLTN